MKTFQINLHLQLHAAPIIDTHTEINELPVCSKSAGYRWMIMKKNNTLKLFKLHSLNLKKIKKKPAVTESESVGKKIKLLIQASQVCQTLI